MKVVCSACGVSLGEKPSEAFGDDVVSHGLCDPCADRFLAQMGIALHRYLETIPAPVVTVTPDAIVGTANQEARKLLGKELSEIEGFRGGEVFECSHAMQPEGCGRTVHCSGCAIRNTVLDTARTGNVHRNVPAYLTPKQDFETHRIEMVISTEKRGGVVFLRIDDMQPETKPDGRIDDA